MLIDEQSALALLVHIADLAEQLERYKSEARTYYKLYEGKSKELDALTAKPEKEDDF